MDIAGALAWTNTLLWIPLIVLVIIGIVLVFFVTDGEVPTDEVEGWKKRTVQVFIGAGSLLGFILLIYVIAIWLGFAQGAGTNY